MTVNHMLIRKLETCQLYPTVKSGRTNQRSGNTKAELGKAARLLETLNMVWKEHPQLQDGLVADLEPVAIIAAEGQKEADVSAPFAKRRR